MCVSFSKLKLLCGLALDISFNLGPVDPVRRALLYLTLLKAGSTLSLGQVSQSFVLPSIENLQGWTLCNLPDIPLALRAFPSQKWDLQV